MMKLRLHSLNFMTNWMHKTMNIGRRNRKHKGKPKGLTNSVVSATLNT